MGVSRGIKFEQFVTGLGFCHGKNYFCRDSGKKPVKTMAKTSKNRQKLAKSKTP